VVLAQVCEHPHHHPAQRVARLAARAAHAVQQQLQATLRIPGRDRCQRRAGGVVVGQLQACQRRQRSGVTGLQLQRTPQ
jgi:hypothetical protein